jgi:hypothetical protein
MSSNLDGELNKFFENVSRTGSSKFKKMPPEERLEYAIKGEALENEIYDIRDQINDMESSVFDGASIDSDLIKKLRFLVPTSIWSFTLIFWERLRTF